MGSAPALTSQPEAAAPWPWLLVRGRGGGGSHGWAQAQVTSHFPRAPLCLGCGPRSPQSCLWGGPSQASLSSRRGSSSRPSGAGLWPTLPLPHLAAVPQLGKYTLSDAGCVGYTDLGGHWGLSRCQFSVPDLGWASETCSPETGPQC